jgi:hypothetical protein
LGNGFVDLAGAQGVLGQREGRTGSRETQKPATATTKTVTSSIHRRTTRRCIEIPWTR